MFKSVSTRSTSGIFLNCLLIALEHIEHVSPVAINSAFAICAFVFTEKIVINKIAIIFFMIIRFINRKFMKHEPAVFTLKFRLK